jgi:acyl dehydratase
MSASAVFASLEDLQAAAHGTALGESSWITVSQEDVDRFAAATGTDERDRVPPYMVLALSNRLLPEIVEVRGISSGINYGTDEVRFAAPVEVGGRLRARAELVACAEVTGGVQTTIRVTLETDGGDAACVIDSLSRWLA